MPEITAEGGGLIVVAVILILREVRSFVSGMGTNSPEHMRSRVIEELDMLREQIKRCHEDARRDHKEGLDRLNATLTELAREVRTRTPGP